MAEANEIVTSFSVVLKDQALTVLTNLYTAFDKINDKASEFGKFITGQSDMTSFFKNFMSGSNDIMQLSRATGYSAETLQKWSYAAKAAGVSADSVLGDMKNLQNHYITSEKGLLNLARSFQKMSPIIRQQYGSWYGMSQDTINLLSQGPEAVKKWLDEAEKMGAVTPKDDLEKAAEAHKKWETTLFSFHKTAEKTLTPFVESLTKALDKLNELMKNNPKEFLEGVGTALKVIMGMKIFKWVTSTSSEFITLIKIFGNTEKAVTKMESSFGKSITEMAKKGGALKAIGKTVGFVATEFGSLLIAINGVAKAFAAAAIIDMLTGGKYSDITGNFWGDVYTKYDKGADKAEQLFFKGVNWIGSETGLWNPRLLPQENTIHPIPAGMTPQEYMDLQRFKDKLPKQEQKAPQVSESPTSEQIIQRMASMNEPATQMTKGGNIFYIYNMGGTGVDQQLESLFNA